MVEDLMAALFEKGLGQTIPTPFPITYEEAMLKYGSDKPDLRFGLR